MPETVTVKLVWLESLLLITKSKLKAPSALTVYSMVNAPLLAPPMMLWAPAPDVTVAETFDKLWTTTPVTSSCAAPTGLLIT